MIAFGPIPSRRLGKSLGINNIPFKYCTYSCVYCQLGLTNHLIHCRKQFYPPDQILKNVENKLEKLKILGEKIDFITFVPDGEPTLDINIGTEIKMLKKFGFKIAVITNSSLLSDSSVRNELKSADLVSLKIDTAYSNIWRRVNRPHGLSELQKILESLVEFSAEFKGKLITETMLVKGYNDRFESIYKTAETVKQINPDKAYILIPTRPPAENAVSHPDEYNLNHAFRVFNNFMIDTEILSYNEGTDFTGYNSDIEKELLGILAVHPMRKDAAEKYLAKSNSEYCLLKNLIDKHKIREVFFNNNSYFMIVN